jgi:hypothetical protein
VSVDTLSERSLSRVASLEIWFGQVDLAARRRHYQQKLHRRGSWAATWCGSAATFPSTHVSANELLRARQRIWLA